MTDVILHIGLGKNGSSALQTALSKKPVLQVKDSFSSKLIYVAIDNSGQIYAGKELSDKALYSPQKYLASTDLYKTNWSDKIYEKIQSRLSLLSDNGKNIIVMSNEGWSHQADLFENSSFFEKLTLNAKAICYIRNPVELINSAWWQWGAWSGHSFEEVLGVIIPMLSNLYVELEKWQKLIGEKNVTVKILPKDIVSDFAYFAGLDNSLKNVSNRSNKSLPGEFLRFFQIHGELRPSMHDSSIDFILSEVFNLDSECDKTPWVLTKDLMKLILRETKAGNEKLFEMLDKESKESFLKDPKWREIDAFDDKEIVSPDCIDLCLPNEKIDQMLFQSIQIIKKMYLENLGLKQELQKFSPTSK